MIISPEKEPVADSVTDIFFLTLDNFEKHFFGKPRVLLTNNSINLKYNTFHLQFRRQNADNLQLVSRLQC